MGIEVGSLLNDRYRIIEIIAQGGMGAIYRAQDETLGVQVALKENLFPTDESSRQFHREAVILGSLRHPNLPRVTDHFIIQGQGQYLVMDYIEGDDLRQRMVREETISEELALIIGVSVCSALISLHTHTPPIIHRDIKPGNIKISPSGKIYLVDFGLAKISQSGQATTTGAQGLTPGYAPPEQYGHGTNPRSDIYALGATLYAALTGKVPEDALSRAMGSASLTPIRSHNPRVSEKTARVIEKAMEIDQANRYQSVDEFRAAFFAINPALSKLSEAYSEPGSRPPTVQGGFSSPLGSTSPVDLSGKTVSVQRSSMTSSTGLTRRSPVVLMILIIGVLGSLALIVISLIVFPRLFSPNSKPAVQTSIPVLSPAPSQTLPPAPQSSPTTPAQNPSPAVIQPTQAPTAVPLPTLTPTQAAPSATPAATQIVTPAATPLGGVRGQIAFVSERSGRPQVYLLSSSGGEAAQLTSLPDGACQPAWSPDGKRLVVTSPCPGKRDSYPGSILYLVNVDGSGVMPLPSVPGGDYDADWSPDGTKIAFTSLRDGPPHIFTITFSDLSIAGLSSPSNRDRSPAWSPDGKTIAYETNRLGQPQVWVMGAKGENPREFSILSNGFAYTPDWSPDGQILLYSQGSGLPWLVVRQFNKQGANEVKINEKIRPIEYARYSPDGFWIAYQNNAAGNDDIYLMNQTGADIRQLTKDPKPDYHPAWQP